MTKNKTPRLTRRKYYLNQGQKALWIAQQLHPHSAAYQCAELLEFDEGADVDLDLLERVITTCLQQLLVFHLRYGAPDHATAHPAPIAVERTHVPGTRPAVVEFAQRELGSACFEVLEGQALTKHLLITDDEGKHYWLARFHHITGDGFAFHALLSWVAASYSAEATGRAAPPPPLEWDYLLTGPEAPDLMDARAWWHDHPPAPAPTPLVAPGVDEIPVQASVRLTPQLRQRGRGHDEFGHILAMVARVVGTQGGADYGDAITLGLPVMRRPLGSKRTRLAPLVTVVPFSVHLGEQGKHLGERIGAINHPAVLSGVDHLREILDVADPTQPLSGPNVNLRPFSPTFRFDRAQATMTTIALGRTRDVEFVFQSQPDGGMDIIVFARGSNNQPLCDLLARRIGWMFEQYGRGAAWAEICTALPEERAAIEAANDTAHPLGATSLPELLQQAALLPGDLPCVKWHGQWHTRAQVLTRAGKIAELLPPLGPGTVVAVELARGVDFVAAIAAIAEAGAAWCPIDPELPAARREFMRQASQAGVWLGEETGEGPGETSSKTGRLRARLLAPTDPASVPDTTAYVLFTSGSTGRPKAVAVPQAGIVNRLEWMCDYYQITCDDVLIHKTASSFDVSVWEYLLPLTHAIPTVIAEPGAHRDPQALLALVEEATVAHFVPSGLKAYLAAAPEAQPKRSRLRAIITSGEALDAHLAHEARRQLGVEVHNLYGPAEASIDVTAHTVRDGEEEIPIGRPVWNTRIDVLDAFGQPVPEGCPGTLHIGGVQVGLGYLGQPELSATRFRDGRYDTGDRALWRGGELYYHGRKDGQVKLRGQRLELGEIEAVLAGFPKAPPVAVAIKQLAGQPAVVAYLLTSAPPPGLIDSLRAHARAHLPEYMVPSAFVAIDSLPVTVNGKLDSARLPTPTVADLHSQPARAATAEERTVMRAFGDVLGAEIEDPEANFFALGGNSLLAVQLADTLKAAGLKLSVADVFAHPTAAALASTGVITGGFAPLICLSPGGNKDLPPVFCLYPAGGLSWSFARLVPKLHPGRAVFGIQAPGLDDPTAKARSIAQAARLAREAIDDHCTGEIDLVGWSVGGVIAHEIAAQRGAVRSLVLLDAYPAEVWKLLPAPHHRQLWRGVAALQEVATDLSARQLQAVKDMIAHNARLMRAHTSSCYEGPTWHITAAADRRDPRLNASAWEKFTTQLHRRSFPVTHPEMVGDRVLGEVARILS